MRLPDIIQRRFFVVKAKEQVKTNGMSVIVTIRGKDRLKQMYHCVDWCLNQTLTPVEVIIVEDGIKPLVELSRYAGLPVRYLFIENKGHFCKSACYNHGVSNASYHNICGIDADLLMPSDFLMNGYMHLQKYDACFMADDIFYLEGEMADMFDFNFTGKTWQTHRAKWQFHGGSFFMRKQKYFDIGGHDEEFIGHGSEDSEFYKRVHDLLTVYTDNHAVLHVEHGRDLADFERIESNKQHLYNVQDIRLPVRIKNLKRTNKFLKGDMLKNITTNIPDVEPARFDARIRRLQQIQEERRNSNRQPYNGKPNPKDADPVIVDQNELRRRRVMGFK